MPAGFEREDVESIHNGEYSQHRYGYEDDSENAGHVESPYSAEIGHLAVAGVRRLLGRECAKYTIFRGKSQPYNRE